MKKIKFLLLLVVFSNILIAQNFHPLVDATHGFLLGGVREGRFTNADTMMSFVGGWEKYSLYSLKGFLGTADGSKAEFSGPPCDETILVKIKKDIPKDQEVIALAGKWNAYPKVLKNLDIKQKQYNNFTKDILIEKGIKDPKVKITQIIRTDLEGDGVEEVFITASNYKTRLAPGIPPVKTSAGDYTLIYLRKIIDGKVENILVAGELHPIEINDFPPSEFKIIGILDVDNDGKMEVIIRSRYYEGNSTLVIKIIGKDSLLLFAAGCGA